MFQEFKIETSNGGQVFFYAYDFKPASYHAEKYIERNKGKFKMRLYTLNKKPHGKKWLFMGEF